MSDPLSWFVSFTEPEVHLVAAGTHGRVLVRRATDARGVLVGFHGYLENAATQMARLAAIPGAAAWTLVSVEALHRVYRGRTKEVAASWMTREDREIAIADNVAYVSSALRIAVDGLAARVVYAGFSQGAAMAFRAAIAGERTAGVIAVGGDVPPELLADAATAFPPVLLARGEGDGWYTAAGLDADVAALRARGVPVEPVRHGGGHAWTDAVSDAAARWLDSLR